MTQVSLCKYLAIFAQQLLIYRVKFTCTARSSHSLKLSVKVTEVLLAFTSYIYIVILSIISFPSMNPDICRLYVKLLTISQHEHMPKGHGLLLS